MTVSTQVLSEFHTAVTHRRRASPMTHEEATAWIKPWKRHDVRPITLAHVDRALALRDRLKIHYFDSLVLAAARLAVLRNRAI